MNGISESRLLSAGLVGLADPGRLTAKAGAGSPSPISVAPAPLVTSAASEQIERPAAETRASEPTRAQSAEQRLRRNRPEEAPSHIGEGAPEVDLSFGDFLDLINPLQHIPIVSTIYRAITGDEIGGPAKILGGFLFGGPIGLITSAFDTILTQATGRDIGETVLAAFVDRDEAPTPQLAARQDLEETVTQDDAPEAPEAPEDSASIADSNPGQALSHGDPFGLERGVAAPIAVTPAALTLDAAPSARLPAQSAWPLTAPTPGSQAVTAPGIGLGESSLVAVAWGPDTAPVPAAAGAPVIDVELISAGAPRPGNQHLIPGIATTDRGFAERMLEALDKYQAQASERYRDDRRALHRLDLNL